MHVFEEPLLHSVLEDDRQGVGVMKDEEVKLEEIEVSHTLGGVGRYYTVVIHS
jgi:hypothetical protein